MGIEVLIITPGRLLNLITRNDIYLDKLSTVILDEVDVLYSDLSFPLAPIGEKCSVDTQFIFTTATLPSNILKQIQMEFPGVVCLYGPGLHRIAPNIQEVLIDCSGRFNSRLDYFSYTLYSHYTLSAMIYRIS